jgi:D-3-phosphoglycerate dehydrogenase / 2-oxoglutarate reductase
MPRPLKIVFLDSIHPILIERLCDFGFQCLDVSQEPNKKALFALKDAFGIVIRSRFTLDKELLSPLKNLKFIARSGSGLENIDTEYCAEKGVELFNSPEGNRIAVAEHALGMLLSLMNNLHKADKEVKNGLWLREENRGEEISGKCIGIIGYGNTGSSFAQVLRGLDVRVLAYDKYKTGFGSHFVQECTLPALIEQADVISLHVPLNKETRRLVNTKFIINLKKPIYLLNLSRGKVVSTSALVEGLKAGKIKGAALDVLEYETKSFEDFFEQNLPKEFAFLINSNNIILSPHIAGWSKESYFKLSNVLAEKIISWGNSLHLSL